MLWFEELKNVCTAAPFNCIIIARAITMMTLTAESIIMYSRELCARLALATARIAFIAVVCASIIYPPIRIIPQERALMLLSSL
jgi:hypothetical protein